MTRLWPRCNAITSVRQVSPKDPGTVTWSLDPYTEVVICKRRRWHVGPCGDPTQEQDR